MQSDTNDFPAKTVQQIKLSKVESDEARKESNFEVLHSSFVNYVIPAEVKTKIRIF